MPKKVVKRKTINPNHDYIVTTIERLVKKESLVDFWPREYKLLKQLLTKYPDRKIWANLGDFQVNSLAFYKTQKGEEEIKKAINNINYQLKEQEKIELSPEKIGPDINIDKILSLKEFLLKYER